MFFLQKFAQFKRNEDIWQISVIGNVKLSNIFILI